MTMTVVEGETSETSSDAMINDSESQIEKSTTTTAVGFESTTMSQQQTTTLSMTRKVVVATRVIDNVATTTSEVEPKTIFMGHEILSFHALVVSSFIVLFKN